MQIESGVKFEQQISKPSGYHVEHKPFHLCYLQFTLLLVLTHDLVKDHVIGGHSYLFNYLCDKFSSVVHMVLCCVNRLS